MGATIQYSVFASQSALLSRESVSDRLSLEEVQDLPSDTPLDFAHVKIPAVVSQGLEINPERHLLAVASNYFENSDGTGGTYIGLSSVWEQMPSNSTANGNKGSWQILQGLDTAGPVDIETFEIDDVPWIAISNVRI